MKVLIVMSCFCLAGTIASANTTPKARPTECVVKTYDQTGAYLATLQTADGQPLGLAEAATTAQLLNARHNNGSNPVVAQYTCS